MNKKIPTDFYVILVEPKYGGNVGAVARTMMNFDFEKLYLVNPCKIDDEGYARSKHAHEILENALIFDNFKEVANKMDYLIATSSIENKKDKKHLRKSVIVSEFSQKIFEVEGKIGLVFGREDYGLYNDEIAKCDVMLKIPSSEKYLSLNLSHAVAIVLYNIFLNRSFEPKETRDMGNIEKEKLFEAFSNLLDSINYPIHKKEKTEIMFKRIIGRSMPSKWEFHTLMGVLNKYNKNIGDKKD